ncbi:primosomal protein N' [Corynebacterium sp. TAE3-ERU12]|uniref:primosomal protein N' n=1 Tax=Corynebacterium sp. TAE3-ERU12 TaxID=2849491 RepID=UPI001C46035D|nr:primosomal protein N' [Corynebacterium sp. TAE3-ERU12]MBV7295395.1 primosomal protein N' [Corynebacterium sp. TAE3-ERU12]
MTAAPHIPADLRVARVLPLLGLPHLDRTFDYRVPDDMDAAAQPGVRVRVRFAGRLTDAIVIERGTTTDHAGQLASLQSVLSPEVVYPDRLAELVNVLADYTGGVRSDIIRSAIPGRHARVEKSRAGLQPPTWEELGPAEGSATGPDIDLSGWDSYAWAGSFIGAVGAGKPVRAAWHPAPGEDPYARLAELAAVTAIKGGGVLLVVPDQRRVDRMEAALRAHVGAKQVTVLTAELGPEARYRRYLDIVHGSARIVVGTRSAAFAPVVNLRLAVVVDDGDDNLVDQRAPYAHAREVTVLRSVVERCAWLCASWARTTEVQQLVDRGWAGTLVPTVAALTERAPQLLAASDTSTDPDNIAPGRLPASAFKAARAALRDGAPVLVQVPRKGYQPSLACGKCGAASRCRACNGPLEIPQRPDGSRDDTAQAMAPACRWCGRIDGRHRCGECGSPRIRAVVTGSERTAEELGRTFAPHKVVASSGERIVEEIQPGPQVVVCTPGAEPRVDGGYGAVLLLDTWAMLGRQDLRASEDALANWVRAAALARPATAGGAVVIAADAAVPVVTDLLNWDIVGAAGRELAERTAAQLPPAVQLAAVDGTPAAINRFLDDAELPEAATVLGPVPLPAGSRPPPGMDAADTRRILVRVPHGQGRRLGRALRTAAATRALDRCEPPVRVMMDPLRIG